MQHIKQESEKAKALIEQSFKYLSAKNLSEVVQHDAAQEVAKIELKKYRDVLDEEVTESRQPKVIQSTTGEFIDLNAGDWEIIGY